MNKLYLFLTTIFSTLVFSQTILNLPEGTSRTVSDPQAVVLAPGFHARSSVSNPFVAKIGASSEITQAPVNTNAGSTNPSGSVGNTSLSFHDTKGNIEVNGGGQLQYTLPIALPPGVKSVGPQVNLIYTSDSGNGIAGYGWNLSAITSISRVGRIIEKDGEVRGIKLDYSDYYSFNGQRLILKSGEYGKAGSEYVTEKYSNIKVKSLGSISGQVWKGPEYWEVTFEDGSQAWYGATAAGASFARTPIEYNIVKWKDSQGNYITYNYTQNGNSALLSNIKWGGNESLGKAHYNEIKFTYKTRNLIETSYVKGLMFLQNKILNFITVNTNSKLFKKYEIEYEVNANISKLELVKSITELNSELEKSSSAIFSRSTVNSICEKEDLYANIISENQVYGDFDGDGRVDLLYYSSGSSGYYECLETDDYGNCQSTGEYIEGAEPGTYIAFNKFEGELKKIKVSNEDLSKGTIVSGLLDSEGRISTSQGLVIKKEIEASGNIPKKLQFKTYLLKNNILTMIKEREISFSLYDKTGTYPPNPGLFEGYQTFTTKAGNIKEADINGDGISELVFSAHSIRCTTSYIYQSGDFEQIPQEEVVCEDYFENFLIDLNSNADSIESMKFAHDVDKVDILDMTGDGKSDLIIKGQNHFYLKTNHDIAGGKSWTTDVLVEFNGEVKGLRYGDFNGDGKIDFIVPEKSSEKTNNWRLYINQDNLSFKEQFLPNFATYRKEPEVSLSGRRRENIYYNIVKDVNNDGRSDFLYVHSETFRKHDLGANRDSSYDLIIKSNEGSDSQGNIIFRDSFSEHIESTKPDHFEPIDISARIFNINRVLFVRHGKDHLFGYNYADIPDKFAIVKINQGNIITDIEYNLIDAGNQNTSTFYGVTTDNLLSYPYGKLINIPAKSVVTQISQVNRKQNFRYKDLIVHYHGKGILGFRQAARSSWYAEGFENTVIWSGVEMDPLNESLPIKEWSVKTHNDNNLIFPADISENNNQLLSYKKTEYKTDKLLNGTVVTSYSDADKPKLVTAIVPWKSKSKDFLKDVTSDSEIKYGEYYLPEQTDTNINNGFATSQTKMAYIHSPNASGKNYYIGRPKSKTESTTAYKDTKESEEIYTYENNLLSVVEKKPKIESTSSIKESFKYDGWGNITEKKIDYINSGSVSDQSLTQVDKAQYDDKGRFVINKTDNLGLETNITYNDWGQIKTQTDPLGAKLENIYDGWGKILSSVTDIGGVKNYTKYTYEKLNDGGSIVTQYDPDGNISKKYTNKLGQDYKTQAKAFGQNKYVAKYKTYDAIGRQIKESEPYFDQATEETPVGVKWNTISYDDSYFPTKATSTAFNGKKMETVVSGRITTVKELNGYNRTTSKTTDALGNVVASTDKGGTINFAFNAAGQQISAKYDTNIVTTKYDVWGRKIEFNDPSNGIYTYEYDGLGRIKKENSPKGYKQYIYNSLGQLDQQKELSKDGKSTNKNITYSYNSKGLITGKVGTANGKSYSSSVTYDTYGRVLSSSENSNGKIFMQKGITYDDKMRINSYEKSLYSSGQYTKVVIENVYDSWSGELYQVKDKTLNKILWELQSSEADGRVLSAKLGGTIITNQYDSNNFLSTTQHRNIANNTTVLQMTYGFNAIKNELNKRTRGGDFNILESFVYDNNNRLINWSDPVTNAFTQNKIRNAYDIKGRITNNDQVGEIKFNNNSNGKVYQATGMVLNAAGQQNFNQNLLQEITYNENNDPIFIDGIKGDVAFTYGLTDMRQTATYGGNFDENGQGKYTKYYSEDGSYEIVQNNQTGQEKHVLYIGGTPYESNIVYLKNFVESSGSYKFLHKDYLGSILAISDEAGNAIEQRHYDAWGNFTHLKVGSSAIIAGTQLVTDYLANNNLLLDRGYTSHEHFSEVGLIHMNGRLYDPLLRRFLNADENIQDMYNTQNYNKYGYVMNNPLMYNDPNGEYFFETFLGAVVIGAIIGAAVYSAGVLISGDYWNIGNFLKSTLFGAVSGAVTFGIGNVFQPAMEAAKAVAGLAGVMQQVAVAIPQAVAHGMAQATLSFLQGGTFEKAFIAGALGSLGAAGWGAGMKAIGMEKFAKNAWGTVSFGAISGGVGSSLSGGNFWQGAVIGGMVAGLNHSLHQIKGNVHRGYIKHTFGTGFMENEIQGSVEVEYKYEYNSKTGKFTILESHLNHNSLISDAEGGKYGIGESVTQDGAPTSFKESNSTFLISMRAKYEFGIKTPLINLTTQNTIYFQTKVSFNLYFFNNSYFVTLKNRTKGLLYGLNFETPWRESNANLSSASN